MKDVKALQKCTWEMTKASSIAHIETSLVAWHVFFFFRFCIERYIEEELNVVEVNFKADAEAGHESYDSTSCFSTLEIKASLED